MVITIPRWLGYVLLALVVPLALMGAYPGTKAAFLNIAQTWTAAQSYNSGTLVLNSSGGASQVLKQTSSGGAVTVAQLACADLSDAAGGCSTAGGTTVLNTSALIETLPNDTGTGTTAAKLVKLTNAGKTVIATTSDTSNVIGICVSGITGTSCGTSGNASIAIAGQASCVFDNATTAGDFVVVSTGTNGDCHDAGATVPTSVFVIGQVLSTNGGAGTYGVDISPIGAMAALNSKAKPGGSTTQLQYNNAGAFGGISGATSDGSVVTFGEVHGTTETVTLTSNNYNAAVGDCGKTKLLPTGTAPTITLPNINVNACTITFVTTVAKSYLFNAASGGSKQNSQGFYNTRGTAAGDTVSVILTVPSASAATWNVAGDVTS